MKHGFLQAGDFNIRLALEQVVETSDGCGGFSAQWNEKFSVWARLIPINGIVIYRADNHENENTHWIYVRKRSGIEPGMRFVKGARKFVIQTVQDPDETDRYLVCHTKEDAGEEI